MRALGLFPEHLLQYTAESATAYGCKVYLHEQDFPKLKLILDRDGENIVVQAQAFQLTSDLYMLELKLVRGHVSRFDMLCTHMRVEMRNILL